MLVVLGGGDSMSKLFWRSVLGVYLTIQTVIILLMLIDTQKIKTAYNGYQENPVQTVQLIRKSVQLCTTHPKYDALPAYFDDWATDFIVLNLHYIWKMQYSYTLSDHAQQKASFEFQLNAHDKITGLTDKMKDDPKITHRTLAALDDLKDDFQHIQSCSIDKVQDFLT